MQKQGTEQIVELSEEVFVEKAVTLFKAGYSCSQAVLLAFSEHYGIDDTVAKQISAGFGGGMGKLKETCGAVTGGFMVLGLAYGHTGPLEKDKKLGCYKMVRILNDKFTQKNNSAICRDLLKKRGTTSHPEQGLHQKITCSDFVADSTAMVYQILRNE